MKKFTITNIKIEHFKCFPDGLTAAIDKHYTAVSGDNEAGKTGFLDAIAYCLTGKTSEGESTFSIVPIEHAGEGKSPSVEIECIISEDGKDDRPVTLKRVYKAQYSRDRTFKGEYATECAINGTPCTVKAFDAWIEENICKQEVYKLLSTVRYFTEGIASKPSRPDWQQRRDLLLQLIGGSGDSDIELAKKLDAATGKFADLIEQLPRYGAAGEYLAYLKTRESAIQKTVQDFPVKLNQQQRNIVDVGNATEEYVLGCIERALDEEKALKAENDAYIEQQRNSGVSEKMQKINSLRQTEENLKEVNRRVTAEYENTIRKSAQAIRDIEATLAACRKDAERLLQAYERAKSVKIDTVCQTCGQELPENMREKALKGVEEAINVAAENYARAKKNVAQLESGLSEAQERHGQIEAPFIEEAHLNDIKEKIAALQSELSAMPAVGDMPGYEERKAEIRERREAAQKLSYSIERNKECERSIAELERENIAACEERSEIQKKIDSVCELIKRKCETVQGLVEDKFAGTGLTFDLFRFIKSTGEVKECCNILLNGTPYADLSYSTKYIASLYIVEAFQKAYGVMLPIISDNTESIDIESYLHHAGIEGQYICAFRIEQNCPECGGHSGRREAKGEWKCSKCGKAFSKPLTISTGVDEANQSFYFTAEEQ